jgi:hypothetical protein
MKNRASMNSEDARLLRGARVFISYSHNSQEHKEDVLDLADRLREHGIDAWIDQYVQSPPEGFPRWMRNQIRESNYVLVVCSKQYQSRFEGLSEPGVGLGANWEGEIITQELYEAEGKNTKFIPVVLDSDNIQYIPVPLRAAKRFDLSAIDGYEDLYRLLTDQPETPPRQVGEPIRLPPRDRLSSSLLFEAPRRSNRVRHDSEEHYLSQVSKVYGRMSFSGIPNLREQQAVNVSEIFVRLHCLRGRAGPQGPFMVDRESSLFPNLLTDARTTGVVGASEKLDLLDEISKSKQSVILGHPGTGKTVFLKYVVTTCAKGQSEQALGLPELGAMCYLPIYVSLSDFASEFSRHRGGYSLLNHLYEANRSHLLVNMSPEFFENSLSEARCLVCLDGMDEVTEPSSRERVLESVEALTSRFPGNHYIVTSRIVGYEGAALDTNQFAHYSLAPFDDADIKEYADRWYQLKEPDVETARQQAINLVRSIQQNPNVRELATNPLLLTIMALIHKVEAQLPGDRVHLYDKCTEALLNTWDQLKAIPQSKETSNFSRYRRSLLERIAYEFLIGSQGDAVPRSMNRAVLEPLIAKFIIEDIDPELSKRPQIAIEEAKNFLRSVQQRTGILVEIGLDEFSFAHPTFGEYLAACFIHHNRIIFGGVDGIWEEMRDLLDRPEMQEVVLLLLGRLNDYPSLTTQLIRRILDSQRDDPIEDALNRYLWLVSRALIDNVSVSPSVKAEIVDRMIDLASGGAIQLSLSSRRGHGAMSLGIGASGVAADSLMAQQPLAQVDSDVADRLADLVSNADLPIENRIFAAWVLGSVGWMSHALPMLAAVARNSDLDPWLRTLSTFALFELGCLAGC